ncbi:hypothetical protein ACJMK2_007800 [Sinanodonta woodiana]|uniref:Uncharacterized protein n=1 Tax=Sinanodonta woodiana TaxID=1069815 RepID=A0ABD3VJM0_SINWO
MKLANRAVNFNINCSLHLMLVIVVIYQIHSVDCGTFLSSLPPKTYKTSNGTLCYMCSPGQFKVGDCIRSGQDAICKPCANGYFQTVENVAGSCQLCIKDCTQHNQELIEVCNSTTDNICQCSSGYFKLNTEGFCQKHTMCAPGEWVKSPGNKDRDTICESCIEGQNFSINGSATEGCLPCTRCDVKGLNEMTPCTIKSDAQCGPSSDRSHNLGAILGGIFGTLIPCCIILAIIFWYYRRHQRNSESPEDEAERDQFIHQQGLVSLDGNNFKNPQAGEQDIKENADQAECIKIDEMKSNEALSDSKKSNSSASSQKGIHLSVLRELSTDLISMEWKFFFRELSVDDNRIQQVKQDHCHDVKEQIYQLLLYLNQKGTLTISSIIKAFETLDRNDLAAKYSEEEFSDS